MIQLKTEALLLVVQYRYHVVAWVVGKVHCMTMPKTNDQYVSLYSGCSKGDLPQGAT